MRELVYIAWRLIAERVQYLSWYALVPLTQALHSTVQERPVQLHGRLGADSWEARAASSGGRSCHALAKAAACRRPLVPRVSSGGRL